MVLFEDRMASPPSVAELADEVGVSISHFHHAFLQVIGETAKKHMLRLRVERAAMMLMRSNWQVSEIGLACGFKTPSSFSRAFKSHYEATPSQFRETKRIAPHFRAPMRKSASRGESEGSLRQSQLDVKVEESGRLDLVCLRCYGTVWKLGFYWDSVYEWAKTVWPDLNGARFLGLWHDDWTSLRPLAWRFDCAIWHPLGVPVDVPEPYYIRSIPCGLAARHSVAGNIDKIEQAINELVEVWLPSSGYQPREWLVATEYSPESIFAGSLRRTMRFLTTGIPMDCLMFVQHQDMDV